MEESTLTKFILIDDNTPFGDRILKRQRLDQTIIVKSKWIQISKKWTHIT